MSTPNVKPAEGYAHGPDIRSGGGREQGPVSPAAQGSAGSGVHVVFARVVDGGTGGPVGRARYEVVGPSQRVVAEGTTSHDGVVRDEVPEPGAYRVRVLEVPGRPIPRGKLPSPPRELPSPG